jgi:hypothetical protein
VNNSRWSQKTQPLNNTDAITAEAATRVGTHQQKPLSNNGRWSQNTAISNNTDAITAEAKNNGRWCSNTAIPVTDAITAETLARTTADGLQNTAI